MTALVRRLAKAFDLSSDGFALVDRDHVLARANKAWLEMHGYEPSDEADLIGKRIQTFHSEGQIEHELRPLLESLEKAGSAQGLLGHVRCDGDSFQTWTTFARVDEDGEAPASYVIMSRNLSTEPTAANALRRTGGFLNSVLENIPDMVFVKDAADLRYILMNRAGEELLGVPRADLIGKSDEELFAEGAEAIAKSDREVLGGSIVVDTPEELVPTCGKGARWLHTKKIPIRDAHGKARYLLGLAEDITDRKAYAEAQEGRKLAEAAVQIRDEFIAFASHELRNPLGTALLQADSILRQSQKDPAPLPDAVVKRVTSIQKVTRRMIKLVEQLLDVSKITAGRLDLRVEPCDLSAIVRTVESEFADELSRSGTELVVHTNTQVTGVWDPLRIEEVVINLVSNAVKYGQGKPVHMSVSAVDGVARLTVRDHGIGIPMEEQPRIFDRFKRAQSVRAFSGFGLGLWIVRQIVEAHRGRVTVSSVAGEGATFTVDLPRSHATTA